MLMRGANGSAAGQVVSLVRLRAQRIDHMAPADQLESQAKVPRWLLLELCALGVELERRLESDHLASSHARYVTAELTHAVSPTDKDDRAVIMWARFHFGLLLGSPPIPGVPRAPDTWPPDVPPIETFAALYEAAATRGAAADLALAANACAVADALTALHLATHHQHIALVTRSVARSHAAAGLVPLRLQRLPRWTMTLSLAYRYSDRHEPEVRAGAALRLSPRAVRLYARRKMRLTVNRIFAYIKRAGRADRGRENRGWRGGRSRAGQWRAHRPQRQNNRDLRRYPA